MRWVGAVGDVVVLGRVVAAAGAELAGDGGCGAHQGEVFATRGEPEVGVQVAVGVGGVVAGGVDDQETARGDDGAGGEGPLA